MTDKGWFQKLRWANNIINPNPLVCDTKIWWTYRWTSINLYAPHSLKLGHKKRKQISLQTYLPPYTETCDEQRSICSQEQCGLHQFSPKLVSKVLFTLTSNEACYLKSQEKNKWNWMKKMGYFMDLSIKM